MSMNLGQMQLRIWQLEDELEARGLGRAVAMGAGSTQRPEARGALAAPALVQPMARKFRFGEKSRLIREALPESAPGRGVAEIARATGVPAKDISSYLSQWADVRRVGAWGQRKYYRVAA